MTWLAATGIAMALALVAGAFWMASRAGKAGALRDLFRAAHDKRNRADDIAAQDLPDRDDLLDRRRVRRDGDA